MPQELRPPFPPFQDFRSVSCGIVVAIKCERSNAGFPRKGVRIVAGQSEGEVDDAAVFARHLNIRQCCQAFHVRGWGEMR